MQATRSNNIPFWLFLIGIVLILLSDNLVTEGMFVDGVTYAGISRNMAEGQGTFWNPHYTQTLYPEFRQHPPLALGMEALLFKALSDHLFVERLYSMLMFVISTLIVVAIWKRTTNRPSAAWLPLLFLVAMPLATWCAPNNLLENTMMVFVLLSVWLMILSYLKNNKIWLLLAGVSLFAAFLSKGFTGLFPLSFPLFYCIFDDKRRWIQGLIDSILLVLVLAAFSGLTFLVFPTSFAYLKDYVNVQVIGGGFHEVTVSTRFFIVFSLLQQLILPAVIIAIVFVINKIVKISRVKVFEFPPDRKWFLVFMLVGLSGVLPIMLSGKQREFYMLTALPFIALALGHLMFAITNAIILKINEKSWVWIRGVAFCVMLAGIALNVAHIGKYDRDEALLEDVKLVLKEIPENEVVAIAPDDFFQWSWHAYFMRYGKVSLDPNQQHPLLLCNEQGHLKIQENNINN